MFDSCLSDFEEAISRTGCDRLRRIEDVNRWFNFGGLRSMRSVLIEGTARRAVERRFVIQNHVHGNRFDERR